MIGTWGPIGALAVMLGLIELAKYLAKRRNGHASSGCGFTAGDRNHLETLCAVAVEIKQVQGSHRELGWGKSVDEMLKELRGIRELAVQDRVHQDEFCKQMVRHFEQMECMTPILKSLRGGGRP